MIFSRPHNSSPKQLREIILNLVLGTQGKVCSVILILRLCFQYNLTVYFKISCVELHSCIKLTVV